MLGIKRLELMQIPDQLGCYPLRVTVPWSTLHEAMANRDQLTAGDALLDPIHENLDSPDVIRRLGVAGEAVLLAGTFHRKNRIGGADRRDVPHQHPAKRSASLEQAELDPRGAAIDRQNSSFRGVHQSCGSNVRP